MNTCRTASRIGLALAALLLSAPLAAKPGAHQHGVVSLDVALDGNTLTVQLEAPLDSLLGFEHRPRTDAQRTAADALVKRLNDGAKLFVPDAAAQCTPAKTLVDAAALQPAAAGASPGQEAEHADLEARFEYSCQQPARLASLGIGLFDAFKRIQRIEVQLALPKGQSKQTLKRPQKSLKLAP